MYMKGVVCGYTHVYEKVNDAFVNILNIKVSIFFLLRIDIEK